MQGCMSPKTFAWAALAAVLVLANWRLGSRQAETEARMSADAMVQRAFRGIDMRHQQQRPITSKKAAADLGQTSSEEWDHSLVQPSEVGVVTEIPVAPSTDIKKELEGSPLKQQKLHLKGLAKTDRRRAPDQMKQLAESRASAAYSFKDNLVRHMGLRPSRKSTRHDRQAEAAERSSSAGGAKGKVGLDSPMDSVLQNVPDEELSYERRLELSKMSTRFKNLLARANGGVKRCNGPKSEKRPGIEGLPIRLSDYVAYDDVFVHQKNFKRLYPRNFTEMKHPHLLPGSAEDLYEQYGFHSCAVVGNSGAMLYANFGNVIDKHEVVFRLNQAPTSGYETYVGRKATFRLLNSLWTHRYATVRKSEELSNLKEYLGGRSSAFRSPEHMLDATQLPLENGAALIVSRCSMTDYSKLVDFWAKHRGDVKVLMLNSRVVSVVRALSSLYRIMLCRAGWGPFEGGGDPSSGLVASYLAQQLCGAASVYGFGSERVTDSSERTPYHYYKFYGARKYGNTKAHSFDTELNMMAQLYDAKTPHPFEGHRLAGRVESLPGNARMCRTERGYIVNTHNSQCQGGKEEPVGASRVRKKGKMTHREWQHVETLHHSWEIPLPVQEM